MDATTLEIERLRAMTPAEKLEIMNGLIRMAYELKAAHLRSLHPDWSGERVARETARLVGGDGP